MTFVSGRMLIFANVKLEWLLSDNVILEMGSFVLTLLPGVAALSVVIFSMAYDLLVALTPTAAETFACASAVVIPAILLDCVVISKLIVGMPGSLVASVPKL